MRRFFVWSVIFVGIGSAVMAGMPCGLATMKGYVSKKASSTDVTGGNTDFWWIEPGGARDLLNVEGAGKICHIWMTTPSAKCSGSWYPGSLETTMIRMYWDGEAKPSVDVPLGIFFCAPFDTAREFKSDAVVLAPLDGRGFNMYFPMPFAKSARIELVNTNTEKKFRIYFGIDYVLYDDAGCAAKEGYFHAKYKKQQLKEGEDYVILETEGRGHYVGTVLAFDTGVRGDRKHYMEVAKQSVKKKSQMKTFYWWEGDERITVDGELTQQGTGTEDYFCSSWSYDDGQAFTAGEFGAAMNGYNERDYGRWCLYRWHLREPIAFKNRFRFGMEHGPGNNFVRVPYQSVAYWYQEKPVGFADVYTPTAADVSAGLKAEN